MTKDKTTLNRLMHIRKALIKHEKEIFNLYKTYGADNAIFNMYSNNVHELICINKRITLLSNQGAF